MSRTSSIRTRGEWDATVIAGRFGGGGHRKAAGCTIKATLGAAKRQMRTAVKEMLKSSCRKTMKISLEKLGLDTLPAPGPIDSKPETEKPWS